MASQEVRTLEKGEIYFFYRPKVEQEHPRDLSDVQRVYMILSPEDSANIRLTVIGRKRLPDAQRSGQSRNWGFVQIVRNSAKSIREALAAESYDTKTRGRRHQPAARPMGEGIYRILRHGGHTHLVYALELPQDPGQPQKQVRIAPEASYIISVKNPEKGSPRNTGLPDDQQADFPTKLQEKFAGRRFADADPPDFLDKEGTEFVLVSASDDIGAELGIELHPADESAGSADVFKELHLDRSRRKTRPLFKGNWE